MRCEDDLRLPEWQSELQAVLSETDPRKLESLVYAAETAIFNRMQALNGNPDGSAEQMAIPEAIRKLRRVQIEILGYPDWRSKAGPGNHYASRARSIS